VARVEKRVSPEISGGEGEKQGGAGKVYLRRRDGENVERRINVSHSRVAT